MPALDEPRIARWIESVALDHGFRIGRISYCFCGDDYILTANRQFVGHDYYTDVITFDYTHDGEISDRKSVV